MTTDSKLMELILKTAGVDEYEPKCAQQLLEFAHSKLSSMLHINSGNIYK
jgi:hypothetical protein